MKKREDSTPYLTGNGSYNRESGNKTLAFVTIIITLIVGLTVVFLFLTLHK